ncbi:hypothetical protein J4450_06375 [Candidatus Micrarchaeota archaeon]|nr:hypothetical protein [Candidatus Micrarchaeota archaeon]
MLMTHKSVIGGSTVEWRKASKLSILLSRLKLMPDYNCMVEEMAATIRNGAPKREARGLPKMSEDDIRREAESAARAIIDNPDAFVKRDQSTYLRQYFQSSSVMIDINSSHPISKVYGRYTVSWNPVEGFQTNKIKEKAIKIIYIYPRGVRKLIEDVKEFFRNLIEERRINRFKRDVLEAAKDDFRIAAFVQQHGATMGLL